MAKEEKQELFMAKEEKKKLFMVYIDIIKADCRNKYQKMNFATKNGKEEEKKKAFLWLVLILIQKRVIYGLLIADAQLYDKHQIFIPRA